MGVRVEVGVEGQSGGSSGFTAGLLQQQLRFFGQELSRCGYWSHPNPKQC